MPTLTPASLSTARDRGADRRGRGGGHYDREPIRGRPPPDGHVARARPLLPDPVGGAGGDRVTGIRHRRSPRREPPSRPGTGALPRFIGEPMDARDGRASDAYLQEAEAHQCRSRAGAVEIALTIALTLFAVAALALLKPERVDAGSSSEWWSSIRLPDHFRARRLRLHPARLCDRPIVRSATRRPTALSSCVRTRRSRINPFVGSTKSVSPPLLRAPR